MLLRLRERRDERGLLGPRRPDRGRRDRRGRLAVLPDAEPTSTARARSIPLPAETRSERGPSPPRWVATDEEANVLPIPRRGRGPVRTERPATGRFRANVLEGVLDERCSRRPRAAATARVAGGRRWAAREDVGPDPVPGLRHLSSERGEAAHDRRGRRRPAVVDQRDPHGSDLRAGGRALRAGGRERRRARTQLLGTCSSGRSEA